MFKQREVARHYLTSIAGHRQVEVGVVVFDVAHQFFHFNRGGQFLAYLPPQGSLGRLTGFNLSAGKLPTVLICAVATLRGKDLAVVDDVTPIY